MEVRYNVTGEKRKEMVKVVSYIVGASPVYMRMPTCNYVVGGFTITKDGTLICEEQSDDVGKVLDGLRSVGFLAETAASASAEPAHPSESENDRSEVESASQGDTVGLTVSFPAAAFSAEALNNLNALFSSKGQLIRKALGIEILPIQEDGTTVSFPWFDGGLNPDEVRAYTHFISAICEMAKTQKRINTTEKGTDNEKYTFRCFLLRLGFIGNEYKAERKILLRNLEGSSAFRGGVKNAVS